MHTPRLGPGKALLILCACLAAWPGSASATTYLPLPDADLARRSGIIVLAEVVDEEVEALETGAGVLPFTRTRMRALEVLKGSLAEQTFAVRVPGGRLAKTAWLVTGRPTFTSGQQVVLFLHQLKDTTDYALSEFALCQSSTSSRMQITPSLRCGPPSIRRTSGTSPDRRRKLSRKGRRGSSSRSSRP